jgi:hypothetical protein
MSKFRKLKFKFPYPDTEITAALSDPHSHPELIEALARVGAKQVLGHRAGGRRARKPSAAIAKRLEAILETYCALGPKLQKCPTGTTTIRWLREGVIRRLNLRDDDAAISEDTVIKHAQELAPLFRLVRQGLIPHVAGPARQPLSAQEQRKLDDLRRVHARVGGKQTGGPPPPGSIDPDVKVPAAVRAVADRANSHYPTGGRAVTAGPSDTTRAKLVISDTCPWN